MKIAVATNRWTTTEREVAAEDLDDPSGVASIAAYIWFHLM